MKLDGYMNGYDMHDGMGGGWIALMFLVMIAVVALVVVLVMRFSDGSLSSSRGRQRGPGRDAEEILRERLARGEIDAEEFRTRMELLASH